MSEGAGDLATNGSLSARVAAFRSVENRIVERTLPGAREHRVPWSGGFVRTVVAGEGPPIVFLHGITGTLSNFASLAGALVATRRCVLVDLPGHGLSGPLDLGDSPPRPLLVEAIHDVIAQTVGESPPVVVGNSLGAMSALYLAADRPGILAGIAVLGEPAFAFPGARARFPLGLIGLRWIGPLLLRSPPPPTAVYRRTVRRGFGPRALDAMGPDVLDANRLAVHAGGHAASVAGLMRRMMTPSGRARSGIALEPQDYDEIDVPVWFLWGRDDPFMSYEDGRPWIERLAHSTSDLVDGSHVPWFDAPDLARDRIAALP